MNKDYIYEAFNDQDVVMVSGKRYCVNPLLDHIPATEPELLHQVCEEMSQFVDFSKADILIGEEDRGGYLCALMSYIEKKPFTLAKWNPVGLEGEVSIGFRNAYTNGTLFLNGIKDFKGKNAILVEDLVDTGGTIAAMIKLCRDNDINIIDVVVVAEKTNYGGLQRIEDETGIQPKVLVQFFSDEKKSKVVKRFMSM